MNEFEELAKHHGLSVNKNEHGYLDPKTKLAQIFYDARQVEIDELKKLTICDCGDGFTLLDAGKCINCVTAENSYLHSTIDKLKHDLANEKCASAMLSQALEHFKKVVTT